MQGEFSDNVVRDVVEAIDARTPSQTDFIMAAMVRGAWPGGIADRAEPAAREWVRQWGPKGLDGDYLEDCSCTAGHCLVCN